jgi:hypothetical protein
MAYSNDPRPNAYAHIPSPTPSITFPLPYWINKLVNMAIVGCLDPDLVYIELAVAAAGRLAWSVATPSTKQLVEMATGQSWLCHAKQTTRLNKFGNEIANSGAGRILYDTVKGLDIAAYHAFFLSTGAQGLFDFGSFAAQFQRVCSGSQSPWRGIDTVGGWPADTGQQMIGQSALNAAGGIIGPTLEVFEGDIAVIVAWCAYTSVFGTGGVIVELSIVDDETGQKYDSCVVNNMFSTSQFAIVTMFTHEGRAQGYQRFALNVRFVESVTSRAVCAKGGCYMRSWQPGAGNAPPYWNMKTMLKQHGLTA